MLALGGALGWLTAATPAAAAGIGGSATFEPVAASAASMSTDCTTPTMRAT